MADAIHLDDTWDIQSFDPHPNFGRVFLPDKNYWSIQGNCYVCFNNEYKYFGIYRKNDNDGQYHESGRTVSFHTANICCLGYMNSVSFINSQDNMDIRLQLQICASFWEIRFDPITMKFIPEIGSNP